jgi:hypothetical protein
MGAWQYGHTRSLVVTNARQFGHIRLLSTAPIVRRAFPKTPPSAGGNYDCYN